MTKHSKRNIAGILYIIAGLLLVLWSSSILIHIIVFIAGLMLINNGLVLTGNHGLWFYATQIFMSRFKFF